MKGVNIKPKTYTKQYLKEHASIIPRDRELIVESDNSGSDTVLRYKIGDGHTPYSGLKYISSLYALFPDVVFYDDNYENFIKLVFEE